jgi:hypothetical protein
MIKEHLFSLGVFAIMFYFLSAEKCDSDSVRSPLFGYTKEQAN